MKIEQGYWVDRFSVAEYFSQVSGSLVNWFFMVNVGMLLMLLRQLADEFSKRGNFKCRSEQ